MHFDTIKARLHGMLGGATIISDQGGNFIQRQRAWLEIITGELDRRRGHRLLARRDGTRMAHPQPRAKTSAGSSEPWRYAPGPGAPGRTESGDRRRCPRASRRLPSRRGGSSRESARRARPLRVDAPARTAVQENDRLALGAAAAFIMKFVEIGNLEAPFHVGFDFGMELSHLGSLFRSFASRPS